MAGRNIKIGLDYFPVDIDFFEDDKIQLISTEFGIKGEVITLRLLAKIYSTNGYYYQWGIDESALFAKRVGDGVTGSFVNEVVNGLVRRGFFNKSVFDSFGILTSRGIQKRYFIAAERRKRVDIITQISLLDPDFFIDANINCIYVDINGKNDDISTQSKVKESKVKESKVNPREGISENENFLIPQIIQTYADTFPDFIRDQKKDNFSARRIFEIISGNANVEKVDHAEFLTVWKSVCEGIRDKKSVQFYAGNGLSTIANNLPTIIQKVRSNATKSNQNRVYSEDDFKD